MGVDKIWLLSGKYMYIYFWKSIYKTTTGTATYEICLSRYIKQCSLSNFFLEELTQNNRLKQSREPHSSSSAQFTNMLKSQVMANSSPRSSVPTNNSLIGTLGQQNFPLLQIWITCNSCLLELQCLMWPTVPVEKAVWQFQRKLFTFWHTHCCLMCFRQYGSFGVGWTLI